MQVIKSLSDRKQFVTSFVSVYVKHERASMKVGNEYVSSFYGRDPGCTRWKDNFSWSAWG